MQLKNLATGVALPLPDDLLWTDEHAWTPAVASMSYLVTGALLVQSAVRQAGRPITLAGAIDMAWVTRATVAALYEWAAVPLGVSSGRFELTLADSRVFEVAFRHGEQHGDCAPNNPATGVPYFHIPALGWGNGWATGNVLRFNTIGAQFPVWVVRTVQQGPESVPDDHFTLLIRGDVDSP